MCPALRFSYAPPISLRRDTKVPAAPASSLAKAGSILTKAVGSFVGGSSGSAITQVLRTSSYCLLILKYWQVMCPLLEKGLFPHSVSILASFHALVQEPSRMIGALLIPVTAEGVISMEAEATRYP